MKRFIASILVIFIFVLSFTTNVHAKDEYPKATVIYGVQEDAMSKGEFIIEDNKYTNKIIYNGIESSMNTSAIIVGNTGTSLYKTLGYLSLEDAIIHPVVANGAVRIIVTDINSGVAELTEYNYSQVGVNYINQEDFKLVVICVKSQFSEKNYNTFMSNYICGDASVGFVSICDGYARTYGFLASNSKKAKYITHTHGGCNGITIYTISDEEETMTQKIKARVKTLYDFNGNYIYYKIANPKKTAKAYYKQN